MDENISVTVRPLVKRSPSIAEKMKMFEQPTPQPVVPIRRNTMPKSFKPALKSSSSKLDITNWNASLPQNTENSPQKPTTVSFAPDVKESAPSQVKPNEESSTPAIQKEGSRSELYSMTSRPVMRRSNSISEKMKVFQNNASQDSATERTSDDSKFKWRASISRSNSKNEDISSESPEEKRKKR